MSSPIREELATLKGEMASKVKEAIQGYGWATEGFACPEDAVMSVVEPAMTKAFAAGRKAGIGENEQEWLTASKKILRHWTRAPAKETVEAFEYFVKSRAKTL